MVLSVIFFGKVDKFNPNQSEMQASFLGKVSDNQVIVSFWFCILRSIFYFSKKFGLGEFA